MKEEVKISQLSPSLEQIRIYESGVCQTGVGKQMTKDDGYAFQVG